MSKIKWNYDYSDLIKEVQKRPFLYDKNKREFSDRVLRRAAWLEICKQLIDDFNPSLNSQANIAIRHVKTKWRSIRDNYVKYLKKLSLNKSVKPYAFATMLTFLEIQHKTSIQDGQTDEYVLGQCEEESEIDESNIGELIPYTDDMYETNKGIESLHQTIDITADDSDYAITPDDDYKIQIEISEHDGNLKEQKEMENNRVYFQSTAAESNNSADYTNHSPQGSSTNDMASSSQPSSTLIDLHNDDDVAFFHSLLPTVKTLNLDRKFQFRIKMMQYLQELSIQQSE